MHETISIQVGQCGNQVGTEFWKKICKEHQIGYSGAVENDVCDRKDRFFYQTEQGNYVPRAVLIDLEPRVIGQSIPIFNPDNIIIANEGGGAGNNWAHGYYSANKMMPHIVDLIQREVESCDALEAINLIHSIAGGTGSGLGSNLLIALRDMLPKKIIKAHSVMPTNEESSDVVVQPYNSIFTLSHLHQYADCITLMDNNALGKISGNTSRNTSYDNTMGLMSPSFNAMNQLASSAIAASSLPIRFPGHVFANSRSILACTVPVPSFKFLIPSYTPFSCDEGLRMAKKTMVSDVMRKLLVQKTKLCVYDTSSSQALLAQFNVLEGVDSSNSAMSGNEVSRMFEYVTEKNMVNFVPWMAPFFQTAIVRRESSYPEDGCQVMNYHQRIRGLGLSNTTGTASLFKKVGSQFDQLKKRNAFVEMYKKYDADESLFATSREIVQGVIDMYSKCEYESPLLM